MALPDSYTLKPGAIPAYFDAMLAAEPPERFSLKFLENLGFTSTNDRLFVGILKELEFLNRDGTPVSRYFGFLDKDQSKKVLAEGIRHAYSDLFAINTKANELSTKEVTNKLRTLYAGKKTNLVIGNIAKTFRALCDYADFSSTSQSSPAATTEATDANEDSASTQRSSTPIPAEQASKKALKLGSLQYQINIVLPDTRDQAVFDAIFRSLREHLG